MSVSGWFSNMKSGLSVALISVPLAISLAIVGGATPLMGLLTGAWSGVLAAVFCSSKHNVYGPAGSLAGILLPIALHYGVITLPIVAILAGLAILLFGVLKLTKYLTLIPGSALQGFLLGIGLIIGLQQFPAVLGIDPTLSFVESWQFVGDANVIAFLVFLVTFLIMKFARKYLPQVPGAVIVTVLGVIVGKYLMPLGGWEIDLLKDVYTDVQFSLFQFASWSTWQEVFGDLDTIKTFVMAGFGTGIIAILETLISAKVAAKETGTSYVPQREVYGLGLTNIATGLVGGIPVSALVARTAMNFQNGATSKLSGGLVGLFTGVFSLFLFSNALQFLPFAVIAGILVDIALSMINLSLYHKMWKSERLSILIILLVGGISYLYDPMMGIVLGAVISLLMFVRRMIDNDLMLNVFRDGHHVQKMPLATYPDHQEKGDLLVIKLEGELNYITIESYMSAMDQISLPETIVLGFGHTAKMDFDAYDEIERMVGLWHEHDIAVYVTGLHDQTLKMMQQGSLYAALDAQEKIYQSKSELLEKLLVVS